MNDFEVGDKVAIAGKRGEFTVRSIGKDGSLLLFGGDKNPNGKQGFRSVMPDRLKRVGK